jgi:hypothetical protein
MTNGYYMLPIGTHLYYVFAGSVTFSIVRANNEYSNNYLFDSNDGLWATQWAREIWEKQPCQHPNRTLFDILNEKLKI